MFSEDNYAYVYRPPNPNTVLDFGTGTDCSFSICYYRNKPLNKFQIWMYKVCFGITAKNLKGETVTWT